ncbi:DUF5107 domain-containing protein [Pontibacillus salicampi]|uniref:DUF5107 domain-containing protein n=1 Tax=Pontibacillus salicampi TaxID=1449801 RepID=A0ABV6LMX3_9BACI
MIRNEQFKGIQAYVLENEYLRCTFLPEYGGKLASYYDKQAAYEWLFQSKGEALTVPPYGAAFPEYDSSGFDEMFPGIDRGPHPNDWKEIPDHGEVWTLPWHVETVGETLYMEVSSPVFPYSLRKKVSLEENSLTFSYEAVNLGKKAFPFIWTPHALLNSTEASKIRVPSGMDQVMSVDAASLHLGEWGTHHSYPITTSLQTGEEHDLSLVAQREDQTIEKFYFVNTLQEGWCGVEQTDIQRQLIYRFPLEKVPYLGVWKTNGGYRGDYNFALEPCTGVYDDVYVAEKINKVSYIPVNGSYTWTFSMEVGGLA